MREFIDYKVSIITPAYNSQNYISDTIQSVLNQSYDNWEMIIVDDFSSDYTEDIVNKYIEYDKRIKYIRLDTNSGAAIARNVGLNVATGRFIAYLDADDIWNYNKLELQIKFMLDNSYAFSCTDYEVINDNGISKEKFIHMKKSVDYNGFLTNNLLQTVGIMIDTNYVDKKYLIMPNLRRRQDAATWLQVLKTGHKCYGLNIVLAQYRRTENSLSSNKIKAIRGVWYMYREVEKLPLIYSFYCFIRYASYAIWKRIYKLNIRKIFLKGAR